MYRLRRYGGSIYSSKYRKRRGPLRYILMTLAVLVVIALLFLVGWGLAGAIEKIAAAKSKGSPSSAAVSKAVSSSKPSSSKGKAASSSAKEQGTRGIYLSQKYLSDMTALDSVLDTAKKAGVNLVVVDLKGEDGLVAYATKISEAQGLSLTVGNAPDASNAAKEIQKYGMTPAAKITCFKDPVYSNLVRETAVRYSGNHYWTWLDRNNKTWLNPYSDKAIQYLTDLSKEAVSLGYKDIFLDDVQFPDYLNGKAWLGDSSASKEDTLKSFVSSVTQQVDAAGGKVSLISTGAQSVGQGDAVSGQDAAIYDYSPDYQSPNLCPSDFASGITINGSAITSPDADPGATVAAAAKSLQSQTGCKPQATLAVIQAGSGNNKQYTSDNINAEIASLKSAGFTNYILYSSDAYSFDGVNLK